MRRLIEKRYLVCWFDGRGADFLPPTCVKTTGMPFHGGCGKDTGRLKEMFRKPLLNLPKRTFPFHFLLVS